MSTQSCLSELLSELLSFLKGKEGYKNIIKAEGYFMKPKGRSVAESQNMQGCPQKALFLLRLCISP